MDVTGNRNIASGTGDIHIRDVIYGNQTIVQHVVQRHAEKLEGSPYKFLSAYDIKDRDIFFGRDTVVESITSRVQRHKVVIVNGASGSGKSSLVHAGLIPRLTEQGYTFIDIREYSDPIEQIRGYLEGQDLIQASDSTSLLELLAEFQSRQQSRLLLVFDQFERFLINVPLATRQKFIEALGACMNSFSVEDMNVLIVLRQDWLGQMYAELEDKIPDFGTEAFRHNLKALGREEARAAIIRPLERIEAKIGYDEAFVDDVLLGSLAANGPPRAAEAALA